MDEKKRKNEEMGFQEGFRPVPLPEKLATRGGLDI